MDNARPRPLAFDRSFGKNVAAGARHRPHHDIIGAREHLRTSGAHRLHLTAVDDRVLAYEFYKIVPAGVTLVITTLAIVVRSKGEVDQSYDISMKAAREMAAAVVDIVVLGGVPINLSKGYANAEQMIIDLEAELKVKVSTSASAQAKAAEALGCRKVVVAQPYELSETDRIAGYGTHFGCEVLGATGWGSAFNQIGRIPRNAAIEMGRKLMRDHPMSNSILLPSPHWPTAEAIDVLEREFGVNVMTAHQAIVWDALRRCGVNDRVNGNSAGCSASFEVSPSPRLWSATGRPRDSRRKSIIARQLPGVATGWLRWIGWSARATIALTPIGSSASRSMTSTKKLGGSNMQIKGPSRATRISAMPSLSFWPDGDRRPRRSRSNSRPESPTPSTRCWPGTWRAMLASMPRRVSRSTSST